MFEETALEIKLKPLGKGAGADGGSEPLGLQRCVGQVMSTRFLK